MFDALINGRIDTCGICFDVEYHDIEELNRNTTTALADISKISCAILPEISQSYTLLDSGAALGRGNGPLLVCRKGCKPPYRHILVPGLHTTATALVKRLLPPTERIEPMLFSQIAEAVESGAADAGVLIHEGRFVYQQRDLELVADLGLLWEQQTQLPLPLGAIVMRSSIEPTLRLEVERLIRQSIQYAFDNPSASREFVKEHAQELDDKVIDQHINLFVSDFSLSLGTEGGEVIRNLSLYSSAGSTPPDGVSPK